MNFLTRPQLSILSATVAGLLAIGIFQCGTNLPLPSKTALDATRANARAAVLVAKATYVLAAQACLDVSEIAGNQAVAIKCAAYLDPAYNLIIDAANAVDTTWSPVAACELTQAADLVARAVGDVGPIGASLASYAQDASLLAHNLLGGVACAPYTLPTPPVADAGVE
jgi:hypothetical protein